MRLGRMVSKAREIVDRRGGTESVKDDAAELKEIASGRGSLTEKAKAAAEALKKPGSKGAERTRDEEEPTGRRAKREKRGREKP